MKLTDAQLKWLRWLHDNGGSAYIDRNKLIANGEASIFGSEIAFLNLVAKGAIVGEGGQLKVTAVGRELLGLPLITWEKPVGVPITFTITVSNMEQP